MISGAKSISDYFGVPDPWSFVVVEDATARISPLVDADVLAVLLGCMRLRRTCFLQYASRNRHSQRIVSPHALFHASGRYYLRAWCHETLEYRNFALARCNRAYPTADDFVPGGDREDAEWKRRLTLRFRLVAKAHAEAEALRQEWNLPTNDVLTIPEVREACAAFVRRRFLAPDNSGKQVWVEVG